MLRSVNIIVKVHRSGVNVNTNKYYGSEKQNDTAALIVQGGGGAVI